MWTTAALVAAALTWTAGSAAALAPATAPPTLTQQLTDTSGVLTSAQTTTVQSALDALSQDTAYRLYVVLVPSFDGTAPLTWVDRAATASGLGSSDFVLAVSTQAPYQYVLAPSSAGSITSAQVTSIAATVKADLVAAKSSGDWSVAPVAAADGLRAAATGSAGAATGGGSGGFGTWLLGGLAVIVLIALIAVFTGRRRRTTVTGSVGPATTGPADPLAALPTAELNRRSAAALVALDDALRGSEQELGFAQAQFGDDATRQFAQVLAAGKARATEAFRLRQTLDDDVPDTDAQVRAASTQILALCAQTSDELTAQKADFDQLRAMQDTVAHALDAAAQASATRRARIEPATLTLATLGTRFPAQALASVAGNVEHSAALLDDVDTAVSQGRAAVTAGDRGRAVGLAKAAQSALAQVDTLLGAIDSAAGDLAAAPARLQAAIASITADLADAAALAPGDQGLAPATAEAAAAVGQAQQAAAGTGDPLAALARIGAAEAAVVAALAPLREKAEHGERTRALVRQTLGRVASAVSATNAFIETRRGAVGPQARTRLAEADRLARQADARTAADPDGALADAQRAEQLVGEAQQLAQADVERDDANRRGPGPGGGNNLGAMVLGGILLGDLLGGGFGGGGFGGGGFGGGWGGGGGFGDGGVGGGDGGFGGGGSGGGF